MGSSICRNAAGFDQESEHSAPVHFAPKCTTNSSTKSSYTFGQLRRTWSQTLNIEGGDADTMFDFTIMTWNVWQQQGEQCYWCSRS